MKKIIFILSLLFITSVSYSQLTLARIQTIMGTGQLPKGANNIAVWNTLYNRADSVIKNSHVFTNGGNSFAGSTLGSIDNYGLSFITNNTIRQTIANNGDITMGHNTNAYGSYLKSFYDSVRIGVHGNNSINYSNYKLDTNNIDLNKGSAGYLVQNHTDSLSSILSEKSADGLTSFGVRRFYGHSNWHNEFNVNVSDITNVNRGEFIMNNIGLGLSFYNDAIHSQGLFSMNANLYSYTAAGISGSYGYCNIDTSLFALRTIYFPSPGEQLTNSVASTDSSIVISSASTSHGNCAITVNTKSVSIYGQDSIGFNSTQTVFQYLPTDSTGLKHNQIYNVGGIMHIKYFTEPEKDYFNYQFYKRE